jgi:branched-chain amino acid transport system ATP-binding protein
VTVALEVKDLHVHYGPLHAVQGVSMNVREGTIVGILGANGAGKSTLLKAIGGILQPSSGEVWLDDRRIDGLEGTKIVRMGLMVSPEGRWVFPSMSVEENVKLGSYSRKDKAAVARDLEAAYARFPILKERRKQNASTLSGGEQGQVVIARAMLARPRYLLLDEPVQGFPPAMVDQFHDLIAELRHDGTTVVLVEHNAYFVLGLSDYVYVLEQGRILVEGAPNELSSSAYVRTMYLGG